VKLATASTANGSLGPIQADCAYPLPVFSRLSGQRKWGMRTARRQGLKVRKFGTRSYVLGRDWIEFLSKIETP
jgi:hypothetical protein